MSLLGAMRWLLYYFILKLLFIIILFFNDSSTCLGISSLWTGKNLYYLEKIGELSTVGIGCCNTLVALSGSPALKEITSRGYPFFVSFSSQTAQQFEIIL